MPAQEWSQENSEEDPPQNDAVNHDEEEADDDGGDGDGDGDDAEVEDGEGDDEHTDDDVDDDGGDDDGGDNDDNNGEVEDEEDEEDEEEEDDEHGGVADADRSPYSSDFDMNEEEFIILRLSDIRKEVQCPICLGIIRKTRTVMECLHRFCRECIDKSMRMGCEPFCLNLINRNNECPACRTHCASRRSLRDDPNWDTLISSIYPDIDLYEEEELAFQEDEKARNHQIQSAIAQTVQRQTEALSRKRRRSQGNYRRKRNYRSEDDDDANGHDGEKDSSSADERCTEPKPKRPKRWRGQLSPAAVSGEGAGNENDQEVHREVVVPPVAFAGTSEMLVWGKGGIRSNTRYGSGSGGNGKHSRSRIARLAEHLRNSDKNDDELDIQVVLVSLDEQKEPLLQHPYLCGKPALSVGQLCQFIAHETSLPPEKIEILGWKGLSPKLSSLSTMEVETPGYTAFDACKDELQVLDAKETLAGLKAASNFAQGHLMLAYRQKIM